MIGITLSPEQIRSAPPEVRRWLQREIASSLDLPQDRQGPGPSANHLVVCGPEEAAAIFAAIRELPPVANVFFELGREGESLGPEGVTAHRLADMLHRARLQTVEQLDACLQMINQAARTVRNDPGATLYVLDPRGYCLVAALTQKSILEVWRRLASLEGLASVRATAGPAPAAAQAPPSAFPGVAATMPTSAVHMGDANAFGAADPHET